MKRVNGFQLPTRSDQIAIIITYLASTVGYFLFVETYLHNERKYSLTIINGCLTLIVIVCWYLTEQSDPEIITDNKRTTRYCSQCRKNINGMDHHCGWLNTCIGANNYCSFYTLLWSISFQMSLQSAVGILLLTDWAVSRDESDRHFRDAMVLFKSLLCIFVVFSGVVAVCTLTLACFHTYLNVVVRQSTVEWILARRAKAASSATSLSGSALAKLPVHTAQRGHEHEESVNSVMLENNRLEQEMLGRREEWQRYLDTRRSNKYTTVIETSTQSSELDASSSNDAYAVQRTIGQYCGPMGGCEDRAGVCLFSADAENQQDSHELDAYCAAATKSKPQIAVNGRRLSRGSIVPTVSEESMATHSIT